MTAAGFDGPTHRGPQAALIRFAVRFRGVMLGVAILVLVIGVLSVGHARFDVFPEFAPPQVGVQTEAPGLTADQIEMLVTQPLENQLNGVPGVINVLSSSVQGLSVVTVTFDSRGDIYHDRQVVAERLAVAAQQLPAGVRAPVITPLTSSTSSIAVVGLVSASRSLLDLRTLADWTVRPRLLAVPGVAKVAIFGGDERSIRIKVHPDALIRYDLAFEDVLAAARRATGVRGAGFVETANQRIVVRTDGQALRPQDVARTVLVSRGAANVLLGDVADVVDAPEPAIGGGLIDGRRGVVIMISGQFGSNTVEVTRRVDAALALMQKGLAADGVVLRNDLFRAQNFIDAATTNVSASLQFGAALVVVVLFLFLFDLRTAAISAIAIPLSLLSAVIILNLLGATLNAMTLGGLAIAIGEVVDDAVVDVENIVRRLRENRLSIEPRPTATVVIDASLEVRGAVVYATLAVILVFLPVLALPGIAGRFFAPLGLAYVFAIVASLVVALTVTPALCMLLLVGRGRSTQRTGRGGREPPVARWLRTVYTSVLRRFARHQRLTLLVAAIGTVAGLALVPRFSVGLLPELKESHLVVHMSLVPGTSLEESMRLGAQVTKTLMALPIVRSVAQHAGRAEQADDTWGPHYSEFEVDLKPRLSGAETARAQAQVRAALGGFAGVGFAVKTFLTERIEETLSGYGASVVVNVFGDDLDALDLAAHSVAAALGRVEGAADVALQSPPGMPQVTVRLRRTDLERWGLRAVDVLDVVHAAFGGETVGQGFEGNRVFNVAVYADDATRGDIGRIGKIPLRTGAGGYVMLEDVADIAQGAGRYEIPHLGAQRVQTVTANVAGRDIASFVADAKRQVAARVALPPGTYLEFAGSAEEQVRARRDLLINAAIAAAGIVMLLSIVLGHWRNLLIALANLPFALLGGVVAVAISGGLMTLGSLVGFVTLFGITLRNSIMMMSHYAHLVTIENQPWSLETAVRGAADRIAPIVMTSLVTGLGLLPLALGMDDPGREVEGPMALVILGGLATSLILNLLVLPILALRWGRFGVVDEDIRPPPLVPDATAEPGQWRRPARMH